MQDVLNKSGIDAARLALGVEGLQGFVNPADHGFGPGDITVAGTGGFQEFLDVENKIAFGAGLWSFDEPIEVRNDHFLTGVGFAPLNNGKNTVLKFDRGNSGVGSGGIRPVLAQSGGNPSRVVRVTIANLAIQGRDFETNGQNHIGIHLAQAVRWLVHRCTISDFATNIKIDGAAHPGNDGISGAIFNVISGCAVQNDSAPKRPNYPLYGIHLAGDSDDKGRSEINTIIATEIYGENNFVQKLHEAGATTGPNTSVPVGNLRGPYFVAIPQPPFGTIPLRTVAAMHIFVNGVQITPASNFQVAESDAEVASLLGVTAESWGVSNTKPAIVFDSGSAKIPASADDVSVRWLDAPGKAAVYFEEGQGNWLLSCGVGGFGNGVQFGDRGNGWIGGYGQITPNAMLVFDGAVLDTGPLPTPPADPPNPKITKPAGNQNYVSPNIAMTDLSVFHAVRLLEPTQSAGANPMPANAAPFKGSQNIYANNGSVVGMGVLAVDYTLNAEGVLAGPAEFAPAFVAEYEGGRFIRVRARARCVAIVGGGAEDPTKPVRFFATLRRRISLDGINLATWRDEAERDKAWTEIWKNTYESDTELNFDLKIDAWDLDDPSRGNRQYRLLIETADDLATDQRFQFLLEDTENNVEYASYMTIEEISHDPV